MFPKIGTGKLTAPESRDMNLAKEFLIKAGAVPGPSSAPVLSRASADFEDSDEENPLDSDAAGLSQTIAERINSIIATKSNLNILFKVVLY
jgi:hypothetical protein